MNCSASSVPQSGLVFGISKFESGLVGFTFAISFFISWVDGSQSYRGRGDSYTTAGGSILPNFIQ